MCIVFDRKVVARYLLIFLFIAGLGSISACVKAKPHKENLGHIQVNMNAAIGVCPAYEDAVDARSWDYIKGDFSKQVKERLRHDAMLYSDSVIGLNLCVLKS